jgi:hypothetical protein
MSNIQLSCRPLAALLGAVLASCGGMPGSRTSADVDPYNGVLDNTYGVPALTGTNFTAQGALAAQFMPLVPTPSSARTTCNFNPGTNAYNVSCYQPQAGYVNGQPISFFNAGQIRTVSFGTVPTFPVAGCDANGFNCRYAPSIATQFDDGGGGWHADVFPHSCTAASWDPVLDAYPRAEQFPIANGLPLNNTAISSNVKPPLGIVAVYGVTGVTGATCNDLKYAASITNGKRGAKRTDAPLGYEVWMVFDPSVPVLAAPGPNAAPVPTNTFWFNGLQAAYLSGGRVPVDASGNLVAMDGVLVASSSSFSATDPTNNKRVILPYKPGDDGYSPFVRLHTYVSSQSAGYYNAICLKGAACADTAATHHVKLSDPAVAASASSAILIVASPQ